MRVWILERRTLFFGCGFARVVRGSRRKRRGRVVGRCIVFFLLVAMGAGGLLEFRRCRGCTKGIYGGSLLLITYSLGVVANGQLS